MTDNTYHLLFARNLGMYLNFRLSFASSRDSWSILNWNVHLSPSQCLLCFRLRCTCWPIWYSICKIFQQISFLNQLLYFITHKSYLQISMKTLLCRRFKTSCLVNQRKRVLVDYVKSTITDCTSVFSIRSANLSQSNFSLPPAICINRWRSSITSWFNRSKLAVVRST